MKFSTQFFINSTTASLEQYKELYKKILNGTYKYDDSLPKAIVDSLYKHKINVYTNVLEYLKTFPKDKILGTDIGNGPELEEYYRLVNL